MDVGQKLVGDTRARQHSGLRTQLLGEAQVPEDAVALGLWQPQHRGGLDVNGVPFGVQRIGKPLRGADQSLPATACANRDDDALARRPHRRDCFFLAILAHLRIDAIGRLPKRQLAQRDEIPLLKEVVERALDLLRNVDLAFLQPLEKLVGRKIDQLDFVGGLEEGVGQRLADPDAGDLADDVVQTFDVLNVEGGIDIDACAQQLVDVLPALGMSCARRVGVRELVDEKERGPALERRVEIEFLDRRALDVEHQRRQLLEALEQRRGLRAPVRLEQTDHDVGAAPAQGLRRGEHGEGLAYAGGSAEEDLEPPALLARGRRLHLGKQSVRVGTLIIQGQ